MSDYAAVTNADRYHPTVATPSELSLGIRLFLRTYQWRRIDPIPWATLKKPLREATVAVVTTAGLTLPAQEPFDDAARGGDWSWREIPADADVSTLVESHRSETFDHSGIQADANLGLPLDRLRELVDEGVVGALHHRHFSFMGSITAPGRLVKQSAPEVATFLAEDAVDAVLLIPI
jgi:D-proline reductase (dithiol) PrdB